MLRLALALLAALSCAPSALAQGPQPALFATGDYLFVLRGDQLLQYEIHTMRLRNIVTLPPVTAPDSAPDSAEAVGEVIEENLDEEPAPAPLEVVDEGPERRPGAGGKYGGRHAGAARLGSRGGRATAAAIERALDWLAEHQSEDGRWDADGFMATQGGAGPAGGPGSPVHDVGVTGLALLAMLGDGSTLRSGPYRENLRRGIGWLRGQQELGTGLIGGAGSHEFIYDHAIATLAMVEAYGLSPHPQLKQHAQRAIDYLESHRNPYAVWRYQPRDGDNDTSVTAWCVMACRSAADFELEVDQQAFDCAAAWFDQMTDPTSGRTGYTDRGGLSSRRAGDHAVLYPREKNEAMTAATLFCRFLLGQTPERQPIMVQQADLLIGKPPRWDERGGSIDEYAWMFGTLAAYQMGGRHWKEWERHLHDAVVKTQRQDGDLAGSWDPVGVWGQDGGRVFSTAMLCLTLETYYRYTRLVR